TDAVRIGANTARARPGPAASWRTSGGEAGAAAGADALSGHRVDAMGGQDSRRNRPNRSPSGAGQPDGRRTTGGRPRCTGLDESRDCRAVVNEPTDRRSQSCPRLPEVRHSVARRIARGAREDTGSCRHAAPPTEAASLTPAPTSSIHVEITDAAGR